MSDLAREITPVNIEEELKELLIWIMRCRSLLAVRCRMSEMA
ncbi:Uncharacterised protein [Salmonella enterica subsp. enterica serovar Daytona]|uniref:Uncharacterized protein n=1 Tax=Salmonella enterica subsp. enterica serovar Daytona TaxID=1962639 RepID=A0A447JFC0_SALET|nr:Uncharacterised protein [Salmonella enterica subsp. enterica serovar Daytona]